MVVQPGSHSVWRSTQHSHSPISQVSGVLLMFGACVISIILISQFTEKSRKHLEHSGRCWNPFIP